MTIIKKLLQLAIIGLKFLNFDLKLFNIGLINLLVFDENAYLATFLGQLPLQLFYLSFDPIQLRSLLPLQLLPGFLIGVVHHSIIFVELKLILKLQFFVFKVLYSCVSLVDLGFEAAQLAL